MPHTFSQPVFYSISPSPIGDILALASDLGLCWVGFLDDKSPEQHFNRKFNGKNFIEDSTKSNTHLMDFDGQISEYFGRKRRDFELNFDLVGTDFQLSVWKYLQKIPFGTTTTYFHQAKELGNPLSIRAVAHANAKNPLGIIIPCHRVIGSDGSLTGYAGGLGRKRWLLEFEQEIPRLFF